jgi:phosphohistidine swiveling domain-containing protein
MKDMEFKPEHWKDSFKWDFVACPFYTSVYIKCTIPIDKPYCQSWPDYIALFDGKRQISYIPKKELYAFGWRAINELLEGKKGYYITFNKAYGECVKAMSIGIKARKSNNYNLNDWWPEIQKALTWPENIFFYFDYTFDEFLKKFKEENEKEYLAFEGNVNPIKKSFILEAEEYLANLIKKEKDLNKILERFNKEYGWIQNSYAGPKKVDLASLKRYIDDINSKDLKEKKEKPLKLDKKYSLLAKTASRAINLRDDKKKLMMLVVDLLDKWLDNVCRKNKWNKEEMLWLTVDEILELLKGNEGYLARAKEYCKKQKRIGLMTPLGYDDISQEFWDEVEKLQQPEEGIREIRGVSANKGKAEGIVKVVLNPSTDYKKFNQGDILVASMTRPEYIYLMKKASAIITDEGGITSHASIMSRELGIPCIIGTKIATKVLKDGMEVEVDANKGIIKIK